MALPEIVSKIVLTKIVINQEITERQREREIKIILKKHLSALFHSTFSYYSPSSYESQLSNILPNVRFVILKNCFLKVTELTSTSSYNNNRKAVKWIGHSFSNIVL